MGRRFSIKILKNRCKGCGLCVEICSQKSLRVSNLFNKMGYHFVEFHGDKCIGCKKCAIICPDSAIEIYIENLENSFSKTGGKDENRSHS
ncbi:MAG: ferredoxin family protein [Candidatus Omnitrophica bacterium]|nr:ferredoxin family protein [Candidatus Omnitrophota bacterium]MCM8816219.1 ferredoxin family protein [Candidatus Omnitrophota bacterium]